MKKLMTLTFALFLTAGIAFGQNNANIDQETNGSDAKIEQVGSNSGTNSLSGESAGAYIKQYGGDENEAFINQDGASNRGVIEQNGTLNFARQVNPPRNQPGIDQRGDGNWSDVYQEGSRNEANTLVIGSTNQLSIFQKGTRNETFFRVGGDNGTADIDQTGNDNQISMRAAGSSPRNPAVQTPGSNDFVLSQDGEGHRIFGNVGGLDNSINVTQNANNNYVGGSSDRTGSFLVDGDLNTVTVSQLSDGNTAALNVIGNNNSAIITQN